MQMYYILILCFPLILCRSFKWIGSFGVLLNSTNSNLKVEPIADGAIFMIGRMFNSEERSFMFYWLYPNATLVVNGIEFKRNEGPYDSFSFQISEDGKHILIAYEGSRDGSTDPHYTSEIFFIESTDEGESWTKPIRVIRNDMKDRVDRIRPSILLEKDTGRVYIGYIYAPIDATIRDHKIALVIREPGKESFEPEFITSGNSYPYSVSLGYTVEKATGKRYLHLYWIVENEGIHYIHSTDRGRTWSRGVYIGSGKSMKSPPPLAINTKVAEGTIYTQYADKDIEISWSDNHGNSMKNNIKFPSNGQNLHSIGMCGTEGKGIVVSTRAVREGTDGYVAFMPVNGKSFTHLPYPPFQLDKLTTKYPEITCSYMGENKYFIAFALESTRGKTTQVPYGILDLN